MITAEKELKMELNYQEELNNIENCPTHHENGDKVLFRCVESVVNDSSFIPQSVLLKPKYQDLCVAWGLSLFDNLNSAKQTLKSLSQNKKSNYTNIAQSTITDAHGIKHSATNRSHYTFFPKRDLDLVNMFEIVEE